MNGFVALHLRPIRSQPLRALLSVSGVAVGIALMVAMLGLFSSMSSAAASLASLAGSADIEVSAPNDGGLPVGLTEQIAALPGVKVVAPLVRSSILANGTAVMLLGLDPRLSQIGGRGINLSKCVPSNLRPGAGVLVGPGMRDVASMQLTNNAGASSTAVLGRISCGAARQINKGVFIAAPVELAEALGGRPGRADAIEIKLAHGASGAAVRSAITHVVAGRAVVATPKLVAHQAGAGTAAFKQGTAVMVGLALVVGGFCVFNTVSMTALERRRELATLRAIGGHRRELLRNFLVEMALLGFVGSVLGIIIGQLAGSALIGRVPPILIDTVGVQPNFVLARSMVVIAIVLGTVVTLGAAVFPARTAVTVEPVEAMRSEGPVETAIVRAQTNVATVIVGIVLFVGGSIVAVSGLSNMATIAGFSVTTVGSLIAQYGGRFKIADATAWVAERFGNSGRLAGTSIARSPRRTWATVTAVSVATITGVAMGGITTNQIQTFASPFKTVLKTDVWVSTAKPNVIPIGVRFPDSIVDQVRAVPGVASAIGDQMSYTTIDKARVLLQGIGGRSNTSQFEPLSAASKQRLLDPSQNVVTVTTAFAHDHHVHSGSPMTLTTPSGPFPVTVIQVLDVVTPSQTGAVVMNLSLVQRLFQRPGVTWVEVQGKPGVSHQALKARVERALAHAPVPAHVSTAEETYAGAHLSVVHSTQIVTAMEIAVVVGTALALGNALLISVIERRRELGIIRAIGTTRPQIRRMVVIEAAAVAIVGIALGGIQGMVQHRVGDKAVQTLLDARVDYHFTPNPFLSVSAAVIVVALIASLVPAVRATRTNVIEAIGYE